VPMLEVLRRHQTGRGWLGAGVRERGLRGDRLDRPA
jgi:hypothetical protein